MPGGLLVCGSAGLRWWLCPGLEVFGGGVPGQETVEAGAGGRSSAVVAAGVEVGGQPGQDVQAGELDGGGDGPESGGEFRRVVVVGAAGVLAGDHGATDRAL